MKTRTTKPRIKREGIKPTQKMFETKTVEFFIWDCGRRLYYKSVVDPKNAERINDHDTLWNFVYPMYRSPTPLRSDTGEYHFCHASKKGIGFTEKYFNEFIQLILPFKNIYIVAIY